MADSRTSEPTDLSATDWKAVGRRTKDEIRSDNVVLMAAGVAFFAMLSVFPALAAAVMIYGLIADPSVVTQQIAEIADVLPAGAAELIRSQLTSVASSSTGGLTTGLIIAVVTGLWSASSGMKALVGGINAAYDEEETRGFLSLRGLALALTFAAIVTGLMALTLIAAVPAVLSALELGAVGVAIEVLRWPLLAAVVILSLAVLYRVAPDRSKPRWRWASPGSLLATALWLLGSVGFSIYVSNFGSYDQTYGSLGAVIVLMLWFFLTGFIVLLGAELNAELERQTAADTTVGDPDPRGARDADAADSVPAGKVGADA